MAKCTFLMDELTVEVEDGSKLVDVARDSGSSIPFGCTNGLCGTCLSTIPSGMENLSEMQKHEKDTLEMFGANDGEHRLICQCRLLKGDVSIDNP